MGSTVPRAADNAIGRAKELVVEDGSDPEAWAVPLVEERHAASLKLNMRGRSARPLCGTWSSRRAGYSKLIVYGNRRAQKSEIDRCSCVGNNSGLSPLRGPGLELLLVPSLLSKEG